MSTQGITGLSADFIAKATPQQLARIAAAARWYVICTIDGCRTDTAWFEMESAIADVEPAEEM